MKYLLAGNGINIQFSPNDYTVQQIVLRVLKNCDREDFPSHIIINPPYLLKNYLGQLFLEARDVVAGKYNQYTNCSAEKDALVAFCEQYASQIRTLRMTDIGFEDYYLLHDLCCHKTQTENPDQFYVREAMRVAYLFAIYNDGKLDKLYKLFPETFVRYLNEFDAIFTTNYDSNIDSVIENSAYHIHGQFDKLAAVYDATSFRNQLPDAPIKEYEIDPEYFYLYSNALSTHCGEYKKFQLKQYSLANVTIEKLAEAYLKNQRIRNDVNGWTREKNTITANMGYAIQMKVQNPELTFTDNYHFEKLSQITGELEILGLSPWNDFHIFETVDKSHIDYCTFYYFSKEQCHKVASLLPTINRKGILHFSSVQEFWRRIL